MLNRIRLRLGFLCYRLARRWAGLPLLLLLASPAEAQRLRDTVELSLYGAVVAADYHSTYQFLTRTEMRERNPLGALLADKPKTLVTVGVASEVALTWYLHRKLKNRPTLRRVLLYSAIAGRTWIVARNYRLLEQWD